MKTLATSSSKIIFIIIFQILLTGVVLGQKQRFRFYTEEKGILSCLHCSQNFGKKRGLEVNGTFINSEFCLRLTQEQPHKVLPVLKQAIEELQAAGKINTPRYADYHLKLGRAYQTIGEVSRASFHFEKSIEISEAYFGSEAWDYANFCADAARFYREVGDYERAAIYTHRALAINHKINPNSNGYYYRSVGLGHLYRLQGNLVEAEKVLTTAYNWLKDNGNKNRYVKKEMCKLYYQLGKPEEALEIIKTLEYVERQLNWTVQDYITDYGKIYEALNETQKSKDAWLKLGNYYMERAEIFDNLSEWEQVKFLESFHIGFSYVQSFALRHPHFEDIAQLCFNQQLRMKELILNNRKSWYSAIQNSLNEDLKVTFSEWKRLKNEIAKEYALPPEKRSANFQAMVLLVNDLENQLVNASNLFQSAQQIPTWKDVQNQLQANEVAIEFAHFNYAKVGAIEVSDEVQYVAYVLRNNNVAPIVVPLFEEKELGNVKRAQLLYASPNTENTDNLHHLVYQKLEAYLKGIEKIYFSPSGKLHRLNFGAIPINGNETISECFQIAQMGSTRNLVQDNIENMVDLKDAVVIGGINYDAENATIEESQFAYANNDFVNSMPRELRGTEWNYLEWTEKEANSIQNILQQNQVDANVNKRAYATEEAFKTIGTTSKSPNVLHIATHGYFFPRPKANAKTGFQSAENPLIRSGLIMAGANYVWKGGVVPSDKEDGILTAYEIAQMDLSNTEIVVLSACKTGLGDIESSEGIFGLQRAFKMAGVKYVLMSLWSVDDKKTYEFMTQFYKNWKVAEQSIPQAYQNAQNTMKSIYAEKFGAHAWAGFVLSQ